MAIPTTTKRAIDLPAQNKLLFRDSELGANKEEMKRKLESFDPCSSVKKLQLDTSLPIQDSNDEDGDSERFEHPENADIEVNPSEGTSEDSSDDEEELLRELARIKQERAEEKAKRQAEDAARDEHLKRQEIAVANPLIGGGATALRRRWDDDTVFHGQTRNAPKSEKKFVNDAVRSEFHRKFLNKYIV